MPGQRSECPIAHVLDIVGDRWSLLIIRDIAMSGKTSFSQLASSDEAIAPSTLSDRLERLLEAGIITKTRVTGGPGKQYRYGLAPKGVDMIPLLVDMVQWSANHDPESIVTPSLARKTGEERDALIDSLREPWLEAASDESA